MQGESRYPIKSTIFMVLPISSDMYSLAIVMWCPLTLTKNQSIVITLSATEKNVTISNERISLVINCLTTLC